ncbi:helix-turn-helix domain-containing protein [Ruficoccus amylovorans]|uniref:Helix-turn-helix domain-containing protein n=1 Tax=Ruficoccus amylovorans TaxID=1804625 RepID=A0A842HJ37_9BACT|nr:helix-turn-helix domain-containing protein [Ruficoccus amylovorans]MBC2596150.1 helix-turn-helix domain-containing protein [Ruficoccus amylovorans]
MPSSDSSSKPSLLSLQRGLAVLDLLIRSGAGRMRYSEMKTALPGVQDSTLARLLKSLEALGYVERLADAGYRLSSRVFGWGPYLNRARPAFADLARIEVERLAAEGGESACLIVLEEDRLAVRESLSVEGGISVIRAGDTLYFEPDHAGAVAVLSLLSAGEQKRLLAGPFSRFSDGESLADSLRTMSADGDISAPGGMLLDESSVRPGVCRLAKPFHCGETLGCVFYCLTLDAARTRRPLLSILLEGACRRLEEGVSPLAGQ